MTEDTDPKLYQTFFPIQGAEAGAQLHYLIATQRAPKVGDFRIEGDSRSGIVWSPSAARVFYRFDEEGLHVAIEDPRGTEASAPDLIRAVGWIFNVPQPSIDAAIATWEGRSWSSAPVTSTPSTPSRTTASSGAGFVAVAGRASAESTRPFGSLVLIGAGGALLLGALVLWRVG